MNIVITARSPDIEAVHVDISGRDEAPSRAVLLTLTAPRAIIAAARAASRYRCDWVVHRLDAMPCSERRAAAFGVELARTTRAPVWIVLDPSSGRGQRIAGHLLRAGASRG